MVAVVSDELYEKLESDLLITFYKILENPTDLRDSFSELLLLENVDDKIILLSHNVFRLLNQFPLRITLLVDYPGYTSFFREKGEATISEFKWDDFKMRSRDDNRTADSEDAVIDL